MKPEQQEIINAITELWEKYPEQRFFQLLFNFSPLGVRGPVGNVKDPFHYLDDNTLRILKKHL